METTRRSGILYEHAPDDGRAWGLVMELRQMFEAHREGSAPVSPDDRDLLPVLQALEASLAGTLQERASPTAFLDTAARLAGSSLASQAHARGPLIVAP